MRASAMSYFTNDQRIHDHNNTINTHNNTSSSRRVEKLKAVVTFSEVPPVDNHKSTRQLGVLDGIAFIISAAVGSGVFFAPGLVARHVGSPCGALVSFFLGGIISLCGALVYAELGSTFIGADSEALYLGRAFGSPVAFSFAGSNMLVIASGGTASVSLVASRYLFSALTGIEEDHDVDSIAMNIIPYLLAIGLLWLVSAFNYFGGNHVAKLNRVMLAIKFTTVSIVLISAIFGFSAANREHNTFLFRYDDNGEALGCFEGTNWGAGLFSSITITLFVYAGWSGMNSLSEEFHCAHRDIPRAHSLSIAALIFISLSMCVAFYSVLPLSALYATSLTSPFANAIWAPMRSFLCALVAVCCIGSVHGNIMGTIRMLQATAEKGNFIHVFARTRTVYSRNSEPSIISQSEQSRSPTQTCESLESDDVEVPFVALIMLTMWTSGLIIVIGACDVFLQLDSLSAIVKFCTTGQFLFFLLITFALFSLRRSQPDKLRPFTIPLYPLTPLIFSVVTIIILVTETFPSVLPQQSAEHVTEESVLTRFFGMGEQTASGVDIWALGGFLIAAIAYWMGRYQLSCRKPASSIELDACSTTATRRSSL